jgi:parallel beta-helix repeat protein
MERKSILVIIIIAILFIPQIIFAEGPKSPEAVPEIKFEPNLFDGDRLWEGDIHLNCTTTIPAGKKLIIKEGTRVFFHNKGSLKIYGTMQAKGTMGKEVIFDLAKEAKEKGIRFGGIKFYETASDDSYIMGSVIKNAGVGISCIETSPLIKNNVIENCSTAIELWQESNPKIELNLIKNCKGAVKIQTKSSPVISGNFIKDINAFAIHVLQGSKPVISRNTITNTRKGIVTDQGVIAEITQNSISSSEEGIYVRQVGEDEKIIGNHITNCKAAIRCDSFSKPLISDNLLEGNKDGIVAVQFSAPTIINNDIIGNSTGIVAYRKCTPVIEKNNIIDNDIGIYCDYSSYPIISENNIFDNLLAIKLGTFQSADWEKRGQGSTGIIKNKALEKQSKVNFGKMPEQEYQDFIEANNNYWGEEVTRELEEKGSESNISAFDDYYDKNVIVYEDWDDKEYVLDRVKYDGWLKEKVKGGGNEKGYEKTKGNPRDITTQ